MERNQRQINIMETTTTTTETTALDTQLTPTPVTPDIQPSAITRPDYIPAKFWDEAKGEPKVDQLGASYQSLEKAFSEKREIKKPGEKATPEQIAAYRAEVRKITGAPEKPEDYGLKAPDNLPEGVIWNSDTANKAATIAAEYGIPPEALHKLIDLNNENMGGIIAKSAEMEAQQVQGVIDGMNTEWGADAPNNWQRAARGALAVGIDIKSSKLASDPEFIRASLAIDKFLREDSGLISGDNASATYQEQADRIRKGDDYQGKNGVEKQSAALSQIQRLHSAATS
jgi:hypothetical protein